MTMKKKSGKKAASTKATRKKKKLDPGEPIVVGGGSGLDGGLVTISFDRTYYQQDPNNARIWRHPGVHLGGLVTVESGIATPKPVTQNSRVKVFCDPSAGAQVQIRINHGNDLGIEIPAQFNWNGVYWVASLTLRKVHVENTVHPLSANGSVWVHHT
jgi:hypothetical protein